jgi:hypothetical protein
VPHPSQPYRDRWDVNRPITPDSFAVILSKAKDPDELRVTPTLYPFSPRIPPPKFRVPHPSRPYRDRWEASRSHHPEAAVILSKAKDPDELRVTPTLYPFSPRIPPPKSRVPKSIAASPR